MVLFSLLIVFGWSTRINRWICAFLSSFHYNAYCSRTMAAIKHVRLHSSIRARVEPPSVVRQYKHALFSRGSVLTHIAAEKGNWFRTYRWHFRVIDLYCVAPSACFSFPLLIPQLLFSPFSFAILVPVSNAAPIVLFVQSFRSSFVRRGNNEFV